MRSLCLALAVTFLAAAPAQARRESVFNYPLSQVWTACVRLLRIDMRSPITEKDRDEGYFLFNYPHNDEELPGSVEVFKPRKGEQGVRVAVKLPAMPSYVEQMILDKLERKLKREYGSPRKAPPEPPKNDGDDQPDEGDKGDGDGKKSAKK
jgi:hypothetical protein